MKVCIKCHRQAKCRGLCLEHYRQQPDIRLKRNENMRLWIKKNPERFVANQRKHTMKLAEEKRCETFRCNFERIIKRLKTDEEKADFMQRMKKIEMELKS